MSKKTQVVVDGVVYYANNSTSEDTSAKEQLDWLKSEIEDQLQFAKELYEDFKGKELTINTIEAEGFLRASLQIFGTMEDISKHYTTDNAPNRN